MSWFAGSTTHGYIDPNTGQAVVAADTDPRPVKTPVPVPPPVPTLAPVATINAAGAAEKQRKRAAAGSTLLTPGGPDKSPGPSLNKLTLLGS